MQQQPKAKLFSNYQIFVIAVSAFIQFTVILDFMVLSPLGAILMPKLGISTTQFGSVVSAYAFSAGISGLLAAGFADKFDRKKLLLFFYAGFLLGTAFCALANSYQTLLMARIFTGIFGGVIGSIGFAIITDLFAVEVRGRVMGFTQMAFSASQILGLPIGLWLANHYDWHAPFTMIVVIGALAGVVIWLKMKPVNEHLKLQSHHNALQHLGKTVSNGFYLRTFLATILLATGGFMLMPFGSAFGTNNLGMTLDQLPLLYGITGVVSIVTGPLLGKLSDAWGKFNLFAVGSLLAMLLVGIYTHLGVTPFWVIVLLNIALWTGISARMISASALISAVPDAKDRGAFMSINSSIQQMAGGVSSFLAGLIVYQRPDGYMVHYDRLGYAVILAMMVVMGLVYWLDSLIRNRQNLMMKV